MTEMINHADDLKKMLRPLEKLMNYNAEFNQTFGSSGTRIIAPAYRMMRDQLLTLADGKKVGASNKNKQLAQQASSAMTAVVTSGPISQYYRNFAETYLPLLNNWNLQLGKNESINAMTRANQRILDDMMTAKDATEVLNRAIKTLRELLQYRPVAFDLSRHYLKSLQADIEAKAG